MKQVDVAIIGAGVTGTALLYTLSKYTNIKEIALIEKYPTIASVQSARSNNSQTLHFGDIETHYSLEKAKKVKKAADLVKNYVTRHGSHLYKKYHKMALAVGEKEVNTLKIRHKEFQKIFPKLRFITRNELKTIEPALIKQRDPAIPLAASFSPDGYAINYGALAKDFVKQAKKINPQVQILLESPVTKITKKPNHYLIKSKKEILQAKVVVVAASANTLTFAHKMGYGKHLILLPVAGSFFITPKLLQGKVYMMQNPSLPFAAIHADPDVGNPHVNRFGPIARVVPMLERRKYNSIIDFFKLFRLRPSAIQSILKVLSNPTYYRYVIWNAIYDLPIIGKRAFLKEARKIVPSLQAKDLTFGRSIGGTRPQIINMLTKTVEMGEAKIIGDNIIFNITPSPGASVCLDTARQDTKTIVKILKKECNEKKYKKDFS